MLELAPSDPFGGRLPLRRGAGDLWIQALPGAGGATVSARRGSAQAAADRLGGTLALTAPHTIGAAADGATALVATGPGVWLAVGYDDPALAMRLRAGLDDVASVADQGGGQAVVRIGGSRSEIVISKGVFLDLHPTIFPPGSAAGANLAHLPVTLWRPALDLFELAIPRSFANAFVHWWLGACV